MIRYPFPLPTNLNNQVDPTQQKENDISDENTPHDSYLTSNFPSNIPLGSKINADLAIRNNSSSLRVGSLNDINILRPRNTYVPVTRGINIDDNSNVIRLLKDDPNRTDFYGLSESFIIRNSSSIKSVSPIPKTLSAEFENEDYQECEVIHQYETDTDTEQQIKVEEQQGDIGTNEGDDIPIDEVNDKISLLNGVLEIGESSVDLKTALESSYYLHNPENIDNVNFVNPKISLLNPYVEYVEVAPPRLGKPLAINGTPLDLSVIENDIPKSIFPLDNYEQEISEDEMKLFAILDYELKLKESKLDSDHSFYNTLDTDNNDDDDKPNTFKDAFFRVFRIGKYSKEKQYYKKYPWAKILTNPIRDLLGNGGEDDDDDDDEEEEANRNQFERNNTDMFPDLGNGIEFNPQMLVDETNKQAIGFVTSVMDQ